MKKIIILLVINALFFSCSRDWDNPIENDPDLQEKPVIAQITTNEDNEILIHLGKTYNDATIQLERKESNGNYQLIKEYNGILDVLLDDTFDMEINHYFTYRYKLEKNGYYSDYSEPSNYTFNSNIIYPPDNLLATTVELEGIRLSWTDRSNKEEGYRIEKYMSNGTYQPLTTVEANVTSYFDDDFDGIVYEEPITVAYRVKSFSLTEELESDWVEITTSYSGIGSPTNLTITDDSYFNLRFEWIDQSQKEEAYVIFRNEQEIAMVNSNVTTFTDRLSQVGTYTYTIAAKIEHNGQVLYSSPSNKVEFALTSFIPRNGLMAHYAFNGTIIDSTDNHFDCHVEGSDTDESYSNDRFDNGSFAFHFNGDKYLEAEDAHAQDLGIDEDNPRAISLWAYTQSFNKGGVFDIGQRVTHGQYCLRTKEDESNTWRMQFWGDDDLDEDLTFNFSSKNKWVHFVLMYDGGMAKIYANGVIMEDVGIDLDTSNANPLKIGSYGTNDRFEGKIDDLYIYNRELTEQEIKELYHERGYYPED